MAAHVFSGRGLVMISFKFPATGSVPVIFFSLVTNSSVPSVWNSVSTWKEISFQKDILAFERNFGRNLAFEKEEKEILTFFF